jgi:radical SAM superfamily enzyme YgiQ (UPF0313 family)
MAAKLKREIPAPSIFGGIHPTFFPDIIRYPQVDLVCRGEGEEVIVEVMDRLEKDISLDDIKGLWVKKNGQIIEAARILKEAGIKILTNNMLGLPGETLEGALTTVTLNIKLRTDYPWCSILQPYPGTEIADYALKNGYLKKIDLDRFQPTFFESSLLEQKDIGEVVNLQKFFYLAVKFPWLLPLIKRLVRFNCFSRCYNLIFLVTFAFRYMTANRYSLSDMFYIARDSLHLYIKRKVSGQGRGLRSRPPKAGFQRNPGTGEGISR